MKWEEHVPLARHTSWHVGGLARYFAHVTTEADLLEALQFARDKHLPFFVLGKGSNTLFPDDGYPGVIIHMEGRTITVEGTRLTAESGVFMRPLVNAALKHGLRGLEELAGIPGTVGGAVRGNAGTWQTEIKDVIESVTVIRPQGSGWEKKVLLPAECEFGYRHSIFKSHPDWVVLSATFQLHQGDVAEGEALVQKDLTQRHAKQPYDAPSAGSVFKNPDKEHGIFSGALIEKTGLKGTRVGGAEISPKHANFIVNRGGATAADILQLIEKMKTEVKRTSGVELQPEIVIVPSGLDN